MPIEYLQMTQAPFALDLLILVRGEKRWRREIRQNHTQVKSGMLWRHAHGTFLNLGQKLRLIKPLFSKTPVQFHMLYFHWRTVRVFSHTDRLPSQFNKLILWNRGWLKTTMQDALQKQQQQTVQLVWHRPSADRQLGVVSALRLKLLCLSLKR